MPGDFRAEDLLDHIQKLFDAHKSASGCPRIPWIWISTAAPGNSCFELRQPRVEALVGVLVADLAGGVELFGQTRQPRR